jgi:hypothetical protein
MSIKDDLRIEELHRRNGTLKQYLDGTTDVRFGAHDPWPTDPAAKEGLSTYAWLDARGE